MADQIALQHKAEVDRKVRFEFGKNWRRFLRTLDDTRIARAEKSLRDFLGRDRLEGLTFLDIGSGSGLFSLAARRLGAKVRSFDYDTHSVACTEELRRRYMLADRNWVIEQGSALDEPFLKSLGQFDIVYSWGVLHHTGEMWKALDLAKDLVRPGGLLYIAIYNDLGAITDKWHAIKIRYNSLPEPLKLPYAATVLAGEEWPQIKYFVKQKQPMGYVRRWRDYERDSTRGMDFWRDQVDWIGGLPYERATLDQILDFYMKDGFEPANIASRETGYGCNEFLFRRVGARGEVIDRRLKDSGRLARREGHRLIDVAERDGRWQGRLIEPLKSAPGETLALFVDNDLRGEARPEATGESGVESVSWQKVAAPEGAVYRVVSAKRRVLPPPFKKVRGNMWEVHLPDLEHITDSVAGLNSTVTPFWAGKQLTLGRATHADITRHGGGRYSHWLAYLYFSLPDNSDPNASDGPLEILYHERPASGA